MSLVSIRKKGSLHKLPVRGIVKKWSKRWFVLHSTTIEGIVRLEYFDNESYEATAMGKRTIPLRQCRDLSPTNGTKTHPYVFQFTTPMGHHVFAADTHTDMEEWMSVMQEAIIEDRQKNRRKKTQSLVFPQHDQETHTKSLSASGTTQIPVTINEPEATAQNIYEPSTSGMYRVTLELNESARRLKFTEMIYNLDITPETITLIEASSGADVAQWKYRQIRTYGKSSGKFNFECGRTAETGASSFVFKTTCAKEIFGVVHRNIKRIRTAIEHDARERQERGKQQMERGGQMPKQASLSEATLPPTKTPTEKVDFRTHQPMKPIPYKPKKKEEKSMDVGIYRRSKEFGNPPSYEEISAAESIKEELSHQQQELIVPDGLYATVDKSKKKKKQDTQSGAGSKPTESSAAGHEDSASNVHSIPESNATNDPFNFLPIPSSSVKQVGQEDILENPFQLDPFLFSPQPGANSFNMAPGTDPFAIPPPPLTDTQADLGGPTLFDDLGQLDSSTGGEFDIFNFGLPPIGAGPSGNGMSDLPPLAENPIGDVSSSNELNIDLDLLDDRLFDTLAQLDVQDNEETKQDLAAMKVQQPIKHHSQPSAGATASGGHPMKKKQLSKQEFDNVWDGIYATLPTTDN